MRRISAHTIAVETQHLAEVMGVTGDVPAAILTLFNNVKSSVLNERFGEGSWITKHVFGVYSTHRFKVCSSFSLATWVLIDLDYPT